jgi:Zn-finger nucleic acid-binding protein
MTYRDRILMCPHCGASLDRPRHESESWRCKACQGIAIPRGELTKVLARFIDAPRPPLVFDERQASAPPRPCPACNEKMSPKMLYGVTVELCVKDDLVWFDPEELEATITTVIAADDARKGWYRKFRELLFAN